MIGVMDTSACWQVYKGMRVMSFITVFSMAGLLVTVWLPDKNQRAVCGRLPRWIKGGTQHH